MSLLPTFMNKSHTPAAGPWQPIETAPRDGRTVLVYLSDRNTQTWKGRDRELDVITVADWVSTDNGGFWENENGEPIDDPIVALAEIIKPSEAQLKQWAEKEKP